MLTLREIQTDIAAALLDDVVEPAQRLIAPRLGDRLAGLGVYRNNVREGFTKTLALEFPVIERLVGNDYFRQLAREYQCEHPSRSGDLQFVGASFASFLAQRFADTEFHYLADVARLEWLTEELAIAADDGSAQLTELPGIAPELYPQLRFECRSDRALLASVYPIMKIWRSNQAGAVPEQIDLAQGGDWLLVLRGETGIEIRSLHIGDYHFAKSLAAGATLAGALDTALTVDRMFDAGVSLHRLFAQQFFRRIVAPAPSAQK